ncbi:MAG: RNA-binding protein [Chloroflexi bacterium]|nr:RNA-binding protein [Chloroflexota bacterium]
MGRCYPPIRTSRGAVAPFLWQPVLRQGKERRLNIHVGNLARDITDDELRQAFAAFGRVDSINVIRDRYSGVPKGFGFVEMSNDDEARAAIEGLKGKELKGRTLDVSEARPRQDRPRGGGGFSRGKGGGGGGGGRSGYGGGGRRKRF